jgi:hypothetical protein
VSRRIVREGEGKEGEGGEARRGAPRWRREERRDRWRPTKKTHSEVGVLRSGFWRGREEERGRGREEKGGRYFLPCTVYIRSGGADSRALIVESNGQRNFGRRGLAPLAAHRSQLKG